MRVERREHPADCAVDQPLGSDRFDVVFLHDCEHARERVQLLVGVVRQRLGARTATSWRTRKQAITEIANVIDQRCLFIMEITLYVGTRGLMSCSFKADAAP